MGMLETRNLDFKNILIISANEGNIPPANNMKSLIPYALRDAYGLSTIDKVTSLYAFYFYRLIQRANNIHILYNSSTTGHGANGEMSRFITQLLIHSSSLFSPETQINTFTLQSPSSPMKERNIHAGKSELTFSKVNSYYNCKCSKDTKTLTPSTINTYIDCPLKFYFSKAAPINLKPDTALEEDIDNALFGNIIHHVLEYIYAPYEGKTIEEAEIKNIASNKKHITSLVDKEIVKVFYPNNKNIPRFNGQQLLNRNVIIDYIIRQLHTDAKACPLHIIKLENNEHKLLFPVSEDTCVELGGIIDRMDIADINGEKTLRIIDYKTSAAPHRTNNISTLFNSKATHRPYHILQALTYTLIVASAKTTKLKISPSLFYIKNTQDTDPLNSVVKIGKEPILNFAPIDTPDEITKEFTSKLKDTFSEMFNRQIPFAQTTNKDNCKYCDFNQLCEILNPNNTDN
jgi:CRISPR/Cas system-associated exonuclease Cas4 (RecB family)